MGIFSAMVVPALDEARELGLDAVYGQAVTVHPYSQKAAFSHGYRDTGVAVGRARASIRLEGNKLMRTGKRHAIVLHYLVFDPRGRAVFLPTVYRDEVVRAYENVGIPVEWKPEDAAGRQGPSAELNASLNIGTIAIGRWADGDDLGLSRAFHYLLAKHCDMIYAEIDLQTVANVDAVVDRLNREGFFYSGLVLYGRDGHDQLRLQYENTLDVDEEEIICYSDFAQELRRFILEDKARVVTDAGTG